jgi:hypothetical protein
LEFLLGDSLNGAAGKSTELRLQAERLRRADRYPFFRHRQGNFGSI